MGNTGLTIDFKGDFDLGNTSRCGRDIGQVELSQEIVVLGHGSFTLVDLDSDSGLVVNSGGEDLRLLGWDDRVSANKFSHDTTGGLDTCNDNELETPGES
jgi:hypothetical protein